MNEVRNQLATLAAKRYKPNKRDAQAKIVELAERYPDAMLELSELYTYFRPPQPKKPRSAFEWVAKAVNTKDVRPYLRYVYVTSAWVTATDGHRMHRAPNAEGLTPGWYLVSGERVTDDAPDHYPDIERVIPRVDGTRALPVAFEDLERVERGEGLGPVVKLPGDDWVYLDELYLASALSYGPGAIYARGASGTVRVDFEDGRQAVVMPVRFKEGE